MKLAQNLLLILMTFSFIACSNNQSMKEENEIESQFDDAVALEDENAYESEEGLQESQFTEDTIETPEEEMASAEEPQDYVGETVETQPVVADSAPVSIQGEMQYQVKSGDTLMLIAFNLYGDYSKWKDIRDRNPGLANFENLTPGQSLTVAQPSQDFSWRPEGLPYLIKRNETLMIISDNLYSTQNKWKDLYHHNQPLIKDPNVIYAGFTLYYLEDGNYNRLPASN